MCTLTTHLLLQAFTVLTSCHLPWSLSYQKGCVNGSSWHRLQDGMEWVSGWCRCCECVGRGWERGCLLARLDPMCHPPSPLSSRLFLKTLQLQQTWGGGGNTICNYMLLCDCQLPFLFLHCTASHRCGCRIYSLSHLWQHSPYATETERERENKKGSEKEEENIFHDKWTSDRHSSLLYTPLTQMKGKIIRLDFVMRLDACRC